jgi:hypothetical protein
MFNRCGRNVQSAAGSTCPRISDRIVSGDYEERLSLDSSRLYPTAASAYWPMNCAQQ